MIMPLQSRCVTITYNLYNLFMAEDIATGKLVALKSHRLTIDTAGATTSHWLVTDTAGATINHRIVIDTACYI